MERKVHRSIPCPIHVSIHHPWRRRRTGACICMQLGRPAGCSLTVRARTKHAGTRTLITHRQVKMQGRSFLSFFSLEQDEIYSRRLLVRRNRMKLSRPRTVSRRVVSSLFPVLTLRHSSSVIRRRNGSRWAFFYFINRPAVT